MTARGFAAGDLLAETQVAVRGMTRPACGRIREFCRELA